MYINMVDPGIEGGASHQKGVRTPVIWQPVVIKKMKEIGMRRKEQSLAPPWICH